MQFQVKLKDGSLLDVPDNVEINLQGMRIIGDGRTDWNEPYGQNFMVLSNGVENLKDEVATKANTSYVDSKVASIDLSSMYLKADIGTVADFTAALG